MFYLGEWWSCINKGLLLTVLPRLSLFRAAVKFSFLFSLNRPNWMIRSKSRDIHWLPVCLCPRMQFFLRSSLVGQFLLEMWLWSPKRRKCVSVCFFCFCPFVSVSVRFCQYLFIFVGLFCFCLFLPISVHICFFFCISATIRTRLEIQCLSDAGFFKRGSYSSAQLDH